MKKLLLTGASGLLGRNVARQAVETGWEVHALGRPQSSPPEAKAITADLSQPLDTSQLPPQIDAVVHLAQSPRFREFPEGAADVFAVNTATAVRLANYAITAGARTLVVASSGGIYAPLDQPLNEDAAWATLQSLNFYAASKQAMELLMAPYASQLNVVILRFFFIYGPGQNRTMLLPRLVDAVSQGKPISLQGETGLSINPVYAADAATAVCRALELKKSATVNVAGPEVLNLRQICDEIGNGLGVTPNYEIKPGPAPVMVADNARQGKLLATPTHRWSDCWRSLLP